MDISKLMNMHFLILEPNITPTVLLPDDILEQTKIIIKKGNPKRNKHSQKKVSRKPKFTLK